MNDYCDVCGILLDESNTDFYLVRPLCKLCWFEEHKDNEVGE
jgi:hypothetical protein